MKSVQGPLVAPPRGVQKMAESVADVLFDHTFGYSHPQGYVSLGQTLDFSHDEGFAAAIWQGGDQVRDALQLLPSGGLVLRGRTIGRRGRQVDVVDRIESDGPQSAQLAADQRVSGLERIGSGGLDVIHAGEAGEHSIGFLDDVVGLDAGDKPSA